MIDVGKKPVNEREAKARGLITMTASTIELIKKNKIPKGNVLESSRIAGILSVKNVPHIIPLCHPINITWADVSFQLKDSGVEIQSWVKGIDRTGVEMEALTAVAIAALTIYDMCKGVDKNIKIENIQLIEKKKE